VPEYSPPLDDIGFVLSRIVDAGTLSALPVFEHAELATMQGLLEEFGRFCVEVLADLNQAGDTTGARYDPGSSSVTTAPGWVAAYGKYLSAGWGAVPFPASFGGGSFPWLLAIAMQEIMTSACMAFSLCPLLTQGAIDMLEHHGDEVQQETYLRRMVSAEWTGTMNLTEPQAGSDVGAVRTRAVPAGDGTWRISGQKIFITYGEHDMTDNIVHLVLARVPDAPAGTRGISCFIVPKFLVEPDGTLGARNGVRCIGIEHKMGIHASPTCTMEYENAVGYLIGEANAGMRYMFTMMNTARLSVGLSGLALGERAYQAARAYAQERIQGGGPIVGHPDVRRMLVHMKAHVEAMRMLVYTNARAIDDARHAASEAERAAGQELADLLTPITKAWCTDLGSEMARLGTQVFGGMGYIEETGVAQYERDIRIAAIYEGTNGIQAADLVGRKLRLRGGDAVRELLDRIAGCDGLEAAVAVAREASDWLLAATDPRDVLAGSTPYLKMMGIVIGGWLHARQKAADPSRAATSDYYLSQVLPTAASLLAAVQGGHAALEAVAL
jgi:alkylation response protein AidB-like acyl-CoA dehydrogenase